MHHLRFYFQRTALAGADVPGRDRRQRPVRRQRGNRVLRREPEQDAALHMADAVADVRPVLHHRMRAAGRVLRLHAPEPLDQRAAVLPRLRQRGIGRGQHFFLVGAQPAAGNFRRRILAAAAVRHRMQFDALRRFQHHESGRTRAHQTGSVADADRARALPSGGTLHETVHRAATGEPPGARRAGELQVHGHRRQPGVRRQFRAHRGRHHQVGEDRKTRPVQLAVGIRAVRRDIHRQRRVIGADMIVRQVEKIAREVIPGLAVERDAAQHLRANGFRVTGSRRRRKRRHPGSTVWVHRSIVTSSRPAPVTVTPSGKVT